MDTNTLFEHYVGSYFKERGYQVDVTRSVGDWGVDVFIKKDDELCAVQVKNYGNCRTKVSRKDIMELYGAMAYFDCSCAKLVYNGKMSTDAQKVADKLGIECIYLEQQISVPGTEVLAVGTTSFLDCWNEHVMPLEGQFIETKSHKQYKIVEVSPEKLVYLNTNNKPSKVKIDIFRWTFARVLNQGIIHARSIRDEFHTTHSSLIVAIFNLLPGFEIIDGPYIKLKP